MTAFEPMRVRLLVCGERLRRDDGAAPLAVELLPDDVRAMAEVVEVGQLSVEVLLDVADSVAVVVADAAVGVADSVAVVVADAAVGVAAGTVVTLSLAELAAGATGTAPRAPCEAGAAGAAPPGPAPASSHSIPPEQVLALAAELRGAAPRGVFVGLGGADFGFGEGLSAPVAAGLPAFAAAISEAIRRLAADTS